MLTDGYSGYRRRILIEPQPGCVTAELEDDYHRMVVTLEHADGVATRVSSQMKRGPWTTCPGAMAKLRDTFTGVALASFPQRGERRENCTHLHDLALFAAGHADEAAPIAYEVLVTDEKDGERIARLWRDGSLVLDWALSNDLFTVPHELTGKGLSELGDWVAEADRDTAEAIRILRWAAMLAHGRKVDMPAHMPATAFPLGACYTFQPDRARGSTRVPGADIDFSKPGAAPMADRESAFEVRRD